MRIIKVVLLVKYLQKYIVLKGPIQNGAHFWVSQRNQKTVPLVKVSLLHKLQEPI